MGISLTKLKRCTSCGFYLLEKEFHADNHWRKDKKDVWCVGCKHNSKQQGRITGSEGHLNLQEKVIYVAVDDEQ